MVTPVWKIMGYQTEFSICYSSAENQQLKKKRYNDNNAGSSLLVDATSSVAANAFIVALPPTGNF